MARRKKNGQPPAEPEVAGNLTKATFDSYYAHISELKGIVDEARTDLSEAFKAAEEAGIDKKMLKAAMRMAGQDSGKTEAELKAMNQYLAWLGLPVGTQAGMFEDDQGAGAGAHV